MIDQLGIEYLTVAKGKTLYDLGQHHYSIKLTPLKLTPKGGLIKNYY